MKNEESVTERENLRDGILQYLQDNINAADSLEGVMNWWLSQSYKKCSATKVEQVLEQLIKEGLVRKIYLVDGTVLYSRGESES